MPSKFAANFAKGDLLFRNLSYFRQHEDNRRGDPLEGFHRDNPDNDITISDPNTGKVLSKGDFSFLNSTNTDIIFVFCLSKVHKPELYTEFESDCCIEILNTVEFIKKVKRAANRILFAHKSGLLYREVSYYHENAPADFDIKNPKNLAFAKGVHYQHQEEYRMVFGRKNAFNLKQQIVINAKYDFIGEAKKGTPKEKHLYVGNLQKIIKIHHT